MSPSQIQLVTSVAALVSAIGTLALVVVGLSQIRHVREQLSQNYELERMNLTVDACSKYVSDPLVHTMTARIWRKSQGGKDYTAIDEPDDDMIAFMNYFENITVGVSQGLYIEEIVRDNLESDVYKAVKALVRGESGVVDGFPWVAKNRLFPEESYPRLIQLYNEWFTPPASVTYRSGGQ